jgi:hypothetical protein
MVHANSVSIEEMLPQLLTLDQVRERLAATEPLSEIEFEADNSSLRLEEGWGAEKVALTGYTGAYLRLPGGQEYQLTKQGALEIGAHVGIPRQIQMDTDPDIMADLVNWRLVNRIKGKELKALGTQDKVMAVTRGTVTPFSNLQLLDVMVAGLENKYGQGAIYGDYKFAHNMEHTGLRLIVPSFQRVISGTAVEGDTWSTGLDFANSLTGLKQTEITGQLFRWWCTNGCTDTLHAVGGLSRRGTTQEDALAWAATTVEQVLGGLEPMLDHVQELTTQPVAGDVRSVLEGLFQDYHIPSRDRHRIIEGMAEDQEMTAYSLMQAVTQAANLDEVSDRDRQRLMRMGGSIASSHSQQCNMGRVHRVVTAPETEITVEELPVNPDIELMVPFSSN